MATLPDIQVGDAIISVVGRRQALVESISRPGQHHTVEHTGEGWRCSCEGFMYSMGARECRHLRAIREWLTGEEPATVVVDKLTVMADNSLRWPPMRLTSAEEQILAGIDALVDAEMAEWVAA